MKTPNDIKRPNSTSGSLGQLYRRRERLIHTAVALKVVEERDAETGIIAQKVVLDRDNSHGTYRNPERAARKAAKKAA